MNNPTLLGTHPAPKWGGSVLGAFVLVLAALVALAFSTQIVALPSGLTEKFGLTVLLAALGLGLILHDVFVNRRRAVADPAPHDEIALKTAEPCAEEVDDAPPPIAPKIPAKIVRGSSVRSISPLGSGKSARGYVVLSSEQYQYRKGGVKDAS